MNQRSDSSSKGRSVVQTCIVSTLGLVTLVCLLYTPPIGAQQRSDRNRTFVYHGHRVTIARQSDAIRWATPQQQQRQQGENHDEEEGSILPQPLPIPGGMQLPAPLPPLIHTFAPGPLDQGDQGLDVEPNVITDFRGFTAMGYPKGTAKGSDGITYTLVTDMRVFRGEYITADGVHHRGTFIFI